MPFRFFRSHTPTLREFIASTSLVENWDFKKVLRLREKDIHNAPYSLILDNGGDVTIGVNKVEVVLNCTFFELFKSLVVKYLDNGKINLMFNSEVLDASAILSFYTQLKSHLGGGFIQDDIFSSFNDADKVRDLAAGVYTEESDEMVHTWLGERFTFMLNYKIEPLRQLLFSVNQMGEIADDTFLRKNTLIDIINYQIDDVLKQAEIESDPFYEGERLKFIDYTFELDPPELDVFDRVRVRIFGNDHKDITANQFHVIYYSKFEIETVKAIVLCDKLIRIYGADGHGDKELQPHEIDMLDAGRFWTGRNWWMNQKHGLRNFNDPEQSNSYWLLFTSNPEEDGLSLHVTGYDEMLRFHNSNR